MITLDVRTWARGGWIKVEIHRAEHLVSLVNVRLPRDEAIALALRAWGVERVAETKAVRGDLDPLALVRETFPGRYERRTSAATGDAVEVVDLGAYEVGEDGRTRRTR